jgi:thioredoxin reductase (NADPH)
MRDLTIIGGGPAGLSAALNGAAEGLDVCVLERSDVLGGQAGTSSRIENFLGWPQGVDGSTLTSKAAKQATRLGAELIVDRTVTGVEYNPATETWLAQCEGGHKFVSRALLVAVGVDYRRLAVPGGTGEQVLYGAPASAHEECRGRPVVVLGGGNSAGQAALNLAKLGADVALVARRSLRQTMSRYLIDRIAVDSNITASIGEAARVEDGMVHLADGRGLVAARVFAYIGSTPRAEFVHQCCNVEDPGFLHTDDELAANPDGLFVAGDVRHGSFKRVAAAVGEGAIAAAAAWRYINQA